MHVVVRVVACQWLWRDLLIGVSEVDVAHVVGIVQQIWIQSIVVPGIVHVVLALPVAINHEQDSLKESQEDVAPEDWSQQVEPRVERTHKLVVRVLREAWIG